MQCFIQVTYWKKGKIIYFLFDHNYFNVFLEFVPKLNYLLLFISYAYFAQLITKLITFMFYKSTILTYSLFLGTEQYVCDKCYRSYKWKQSLRSHQKYECQKVPQFQCPYKGCLYKAKVKGNLTMHLSSRKHKLWNTWEIKRLLLYICFVFVAFVGERAINLVYFYETSNFINWL